MESKLFAVWKPKGPTSHDIVDTVRRITKERTVGHAGTLDPLAEGVLVIAVGRDATKKINETVQKEKEYRAKVCLGITSATDDEEGEKITISYSKIPSPEEVKNAVKKFIGVISQIPPQFSAIKVRGKSAYKTARKGEHVELKPRTVEIKKIEIESYEWPYICMRVVTGPGVYIRSLARDIGQALGTGGYLSELVRTRVGEFQKANSFTLEKVEEMYST